MTRQERHAWSIVAYLFVTMMFVFGSGRDGFPVFLPALLEHFHWSHTKGAWLVTTLAWSAGIAGLLVGWLLDRVDARFILAVGALAVGIGFFGASQSTSFQPIFWCYALVGEGIAAGTVMRSPSSSPIGSRLTDAACPWVCRLRERAWVGH